MAERTGKYNAKLASNGMMLGLIADPYGKFGVKPWMTLISILLLLMHLWFEPLVIAITGVYRDYMPSSWAIEIKGPPLWILYLLVMLYFLICWSSAGRPLKKHDELIQGKV